MEQFFILFAKFACPVTRQNFPLLPTAHDCEIGLSNFSTSRHLGFDDVTVATAWRHEVYDERSMSNFRAHQFVLVFIRGILE